MALEIRELPDVTKLHPELTTPEDRAWAAHMLAREQALQMVFGETEPPQTILSPHDPELKASWPGGGIHPYGPTADRVDWTWVTHGLAQPWQPDAIEAFRTNPERCSGLGIELVLSSRTRCDWAPSLLIDLARWFILQGGEPLFEHQRFSLGGPIAGRGLLTHLLVVRSSAVETEWVLPGGHCQLLHLIGTTDAEIARARTLPGIAGSLVLAGVLVALGDGTLTDPDRACLTTHPDFETTWRQQWARWA